MSTSIASTEIEIPVPWGIVRGKWWGPKNRRPVLCLHGWQDNAGTFDPLIAKLPPYMSFFCVDLPGHGLSSHIPKGMPYYLWWDGMIYVRRIVKHFGWDKVSIMGHSLGGIIGFFYAGAFPDETDLVISLDAIAPIFDSDVEQIVNTTGEIIDKFLHFDEIANRKDPIEQYDSMIDIVVSGHKNDLTRKSCEILMKRGMKSYGDSDDDTYSFNRDNRLKVGWLGRPPLELSFEFAKRIKCRYLNIKCVPGRTMDNWVLYRKLLDIIQNVASDFKYVSIPGDHHIHLNDPMKIAPIINDFLVKKIV